MEKMSSARSARWSQTDHTEPCCVPTRKWNAPSSTSVIARMLPDFSANLATTSKRGNVNTTTSPSAVPITAESMGPIGPRNARRTVGRPSKRVRVGRPSRGFHATVPSFMATRVPSLVVKLRTIVRCCMLSMRQWGYRFLSETLRRKVKVKINTCLRSCSLSSTSGSRICRFEHDLCASRSLQNPTYLWHHQLKGSVRLGTCRQISHSL